MFVFVNNLTCLFQLVRKDANIKIDLQKRAGRKLQFFFLSCSTYQYHGNNSSQKSQNQNSDEACNSATLKALPVGISMPML